MRGRAYGHLIVLIIYAEKIAPLQEMKSLVLSAKSQA
jgi:hypothetical protein